jgi:hypothetical protein
MHNHFIQDRIRFLETKAVFKAELERLVQVGILTLTGPSEW